MIHSRTLALSALLLLVLSACSQTLAPDQNLAQSSDALITDADLDRASTELARGELMIQGADEGVAPVGEQLTLPSIYAELSGQAVLPSVGGYVTYLRIIKSGTTSIWQLWLANQTTDRKTLVYEGGRSINSTTVNLSGNTLFFTVAVTAGSSNREVYRLTRSNNVVTRLTNTSTPENNLSVSSSGQTVVWDGTNPSTGKRAVFLRDYSGTSFTQKVLAISSGDQFDPTVSGDGGYVAFVRKTSKVQVMRFRKSNSSYLLVATPSTSVAVLTPSVANGGVKVAWLEDTKANLNSAIRVKTISSGSVANVGSSSSRIRHPHLTSDGNYITYSVLYNGTYNVSTKNLLNGQIARLTTDTSPNVTNTGQFWQKGPSNRGLSISGTISISSTSANTVSFREAEVSTPSRAVEAPFVPGEVIIKFKPGFRMQSGADLGGLKSVRTLSLDSVGLYRTADEFSAQSGDIRTDTLRLIAQLSARDDVLYAHPNYLLKATATPNDPLYSAQWHYRAINLPAAWDQTKGSASVTVAVLDSGILPNHPDLAGKLEPGYDFVSNDGFPGDGDGRDADPTDPEGSFHGSHVAGTVAAATNNGVGVAGVSWGARLLPVRVLGVDSGTLADAIDGVLWSVGRSVSGAPTNPNPVEVLNLSLGGPFLCGDVPALQEAFDEANAAGAAVVVAAGNNDEDARGFSPASCGGVITVGATDLSGGRASYSNFGSRIDVMAPGGDITRDDDGDGNPDGVLSTVRDGAGGPYSYAYFEGTSMAAPHVAGVIALLKSVQPSLSGAEARDILQRTARSISSSSCSIGCGAGLIDAAAALRVLVGDVDLNETVVFACPVSATTCTVSQLPSFRITGSGSSAAYELLDVPVGDFYVYAWKDANSSKSVDGGELFGVYQRSGTRTAVRPSSTNININMAPASSSQTGQKLQASP